jgi:hypothetical protein
MDARLASIISTYQQRISVKPCVPLTTYGNATLEANVVTNKLFIVFFFSDYDLGFQFLKDLGLIVNSMVCCKCGSQMSWFVDWTSGRSPMGMTATLFSASTSIRHGSSFQQINLNLMKVLLLGPCP